MCSEWSLYQNFVVTMTCYISNVTSKQSLIARLASYCFLSRTYSDPKAPVRAAFYTVSVQFVLKLAFVL